MNVSLCFKVALFVTHFLLASTKIKCSIGYGQRGKSYSIGIGWIRTCLNAKYCFEATTTDIKIIKKIIDYPWVSCSYPQKLLRTVLN
jgi:hypothetical protein